MIEIQQFEQSDTDEIIALVLHCQNDGSRPTVGVQNQPELLNISEYFFAHGGCFWVAKTDGKVIGCIGLMNCGKGIAILKKFFVYEDYRGEPYHLGQRLYATLLSFARARHMRQIILDTPKNTERAHKFYERAGFVKIAQQDLPVQYDYPYADSDFFCLTLS